MSLSITYYAANETMGDCSESECNYFRDWAEHEIKKEYPQAEVEVLNEQSLKTSFVQSDDEHLKEEIADFVSRLWDDCPWDIEQNGHLA